MRLKLALCGVTTLVPALLLTGCGMNQESSLAPNMNVMSPAVTGRAFGGQQPVTGATIEVVAMGTSGYGSTGTVLASTTTDSAGNFSFAPGAYACPQSDTPVYLLGIGGDPGGGTNNSAVLGAGLSTCSAAKNSFVILNEVTTTALAFALSHFFSPTLGGSAGSTDWFGGPATVSNGTVVYSKGLQMGNSYTIPTIISNAVGAPNQTYGGATGQVTVEWQKINTIANLLATCVNSTGALDSTETKTPCGKLFNLTANGATPRPSDTLQAAVQIALHPTTSVTDLFNLSTAQNVFVGLTQAPNDWSIGVSYTSSSLGLAVNTGTLTTLDIDANGRVWFPSNAFGQTGAAYLDPTNQSFNGPYNTTNMVHPQQVAIDAQGYAWYNDAASSTVPGYLTTGPATTQKFSLTSSPTPLSTSVTISGDDRVDVGISAGVRYQLGIIAADRSSYSLVSGLRLPYPVQSLAGDVTNGVAAATTDPTTATMRNYYITAAGKATDIVDDFDDAGQVVYTGNDDIVVRSFSAAGNPNDGLCIYSAAACYDFTGAIQNTAQGLAIDGGKQLWVAESGNGGVLQVPVATPTATAGAVYVDPTSSTIPVMQLLHGTGNGGTATMPYGIGVDGTGNVWVTNAGCNVTSCVPGSLTVTEIVGAGYPTITPVSAQITSGNLVGTEPVVPIQ